MRFFEPISLRKFYGPCLACKLPHWHRRECRVRRGGTEGPVSLLTERIIPTADDSRPTTPAAAAGWRRRAAGLVRLRQAMLGRAPWLRQPILLLGLAAISALWVAGFQFVAYQRQAEIEDARRQAVNIAN